MDNLITGRSWAFAVTIERSGESTISVDGMPKIKTTLEGLTYLREAIGTAIPRWLCDHDKHGEHDGELNQPLWVVLCRFHDTGTTFCDVMATKELANTRASGHLQGVIEYFMDAIPEEEYAAINDLLFVDSHAAIERFERLKLGATVRIIPTENSFDLNGGADTVLPP